MTLTDEQINALESGPEMDRLVAEACGETVKYGSFASPVCFNESVSWRGYYVPYTADTFETSGVHKLEQPPEGFEWGRPTLAFSRDWNEAMFAAERFGLFEITKLGHVKDLTATLTRHDGLWEFGLSEMDSGPLLKTESTSGPLAICRAILKLARHK